jgi:hypothetical protein
MPDVQAMSTEELRDLILRYEEWTDDLDETSCPTGFVTCIVCEGGGYVPVRKCGSSRGRRLQEPRHREGCLRAKFQSWLTATLPVPEAVEVQAKVEEA